MKYSRLLIGLLSVTAVSCAVDEITPSDPVNDGVQPAKVLYATVDDQPDGADTKAYADQNLHILWNAKDSITVFQSTWREKYCFTGDDGDNSGEFEHKSTIKYGDQVMLPCIYGIYPFKMETMIDADGVISYDFPSLQTYLANSFGKEANTMVAKTGGERDLFLKFKNAGGFLKFSFYGEDVLVSSITLMGNDNEKIAGKSTIVVDDDGTPVVTMDATEATNKITLKCSTPVALDASTPTDFWIVVPPTTFTKGITFMVETSDGKVYTRSSSAEFTLGRNIAMDVPAMQVNAVAPPVIEVVDTEVVCTDVDSDGTISVAAKWSDLQTALNNSGLVIGYAKIFSDYTFDGFWAETFCPDGTPDFWKINTNLTNVPTLQLFSGFLKRPNISKVEDWGLGSFVYYTGSNIVFRWQFDPLKLGNTPQTLYFRFSKGADIMYFSMKVTVIPEPVFTFNKIAKEWFNDIDNTIGNFRFCPRVPTADAFGPVPGGDVMDFQKDMNRWFVGSEPFGLSSASDSYYTTHPVTVTTRFVFAKEQPVINGVQLYSDWYDGGWILYAGKYENGQLVTETVGGVTVPVLDDDYIIAEIYDDHIINFEDTEISRELLNLWSAFENDPSKMLYCNVIAKGTYGDNHLIPDENFHVRIMRPVDVTFTTQEVNEESVVDGFCVELTKFITDIRDWNDQPLIEKVYNGDTWIGYYQNRIYKTVDYYKYYGFSKIRVKISNTEIDNWDVLDPSKFVRLSTVLPTARIELGYLTSTGGDPVFLPATGLGNPPEFDITDFYNFRGVYFNFRNDSPYSDTYNLRIPVEIDYFWGTVSGYFMTHVEEP